MIEWQNESNIHKKENDKYVNNIVTEASILPPINSDKNNQYYDDVYKFSKNEEISYNDMITVTLKLHYALQTNQKTK